MYTIKNTTGGCGVKGAGIAPPGNPGDILYLVSSGVAGAATDVLYTGDGNLYAANSVTTTNVFATRYYGDGGLLSNISSGGFTQPLANLVVSNSVTTTNVFTQDLTVSGTLYASGVYGTSQGILYTYSAATTVLPAAFSTGTAGPSVNAYHIDLSGFTAEYAQPVTLFSASTGLIKFTTAGLYQITCVFVADQPVAKVAIGKTSSYTTWAALQASGTAPTSGYDYVYNYPVGSSPSEVVTLPINVTDTSKYYYLDLFLSTVAGTPTVLYPTRSTTAVGTAYGTYVQVSPFGNFLLSISGATGATGAMGYVGATGATGATGWTGATGPAPSGAAGNLVYLMSSGVAAAATNASYTGDGNLYASNSVTTTNIFATSANIATMNVGYLTVNSAVVYGTSTLNVYGVSNLSTTTVNGSMNVTGPLATLANLYVPGLATFANLTVSNLLVTGNLIVTATNVQTTNAFTINNSGTTTALKVTQNEPSLHTHNVAEFWDATTIAMVIDPEGNVAIHTVSSPDYALTVTDPANFETLYIRGKTGAASLNVTGNITASNSVTTTNVFATTVSGTNVIGTHYGVLAGSNTVSGSTQTLGGTAGVTTLNVTGNLYASNAVTTTNVFTTNVFATGRIGIGTASPGYLLHVAGGGIGRFGYDTGQTTASEGTVSIAGNNGSTGNWRVWNFKVGGTSTGDSSYNTHRLRILDSTTERMTIDQNGYVGIGTASPSQPLDVNGSARVRGNLYNADGTQGYVQMTMGSTTIPGYLAFYKANDTRVGYIGWQWDSTNLVLSSENGVTGYVVTGNLGVGVSPSHKLDVNGNINASSSYYIKSVNMTRKMIGSLVNTNSTSYNYTNFGAGFNNAYNFTYTRVNQGSTIEVIAFVQASHAVGANAGGMSHFSVTPRIVLQNPGGSQQITMAPVSWVRVDYTFFEITNMKKIYFTLTDNGSFLTTGQTMTVYVQVQAFNNSGTTPRFGLNLWGETTVITINEYF